MTGEIADIPVDPQAIENWPARWEPDFAANPLGCEVRPMRDVVSEKLDARPRTVKYKTAMNLVHTYSQRVLPVQVTATSKVEPVFAEALLALALTRTVPA